MLVCCGGILRIPGLGVDFFFMTLAVIIAFLFMTLAVIIAFFVVILAIIFLALIIILAIVFLTLQGETDKTKETRVEF